MCSRVLIGSRNQISATYQWLCYKNNLNSKRVSCRGNVQWLMQASIIHPTITEPHSAATGTVQMHFRERVRNFRCLMVLMILLMIFFFHACTCKFDDIPACLKYLNACANMNHQTNDAPWWKWVCPSVPYSQFFFLSTKHRAYLWRPYTDLEILC